MKTITSNNFKTSFYSYAHSLGILYNVKRYTQHIETQRWKQIKYFKMHPLEDQLQK